MFKVISFRKWALEINMKERLAMQMLVERTGRKKEECARHRNEQCKGINKGAFLICKVIQADVPALST